LTIELRSLVEAAFLTLLQDHHPFADPFLLAFASQLCEDFKSNPRLPDPLAAVRSFLDLIQSSATNSRLYDLVNSNANVKTLIISVKNQIKGSSSSRDSGGSGRTQQVSPKKH
jgi:hypothetical protein